jgi:hypothetical protein
MSKLSLHATPYDISARGFYFGSLDEYEKKAESAVNEYGDPVEEFEIQFIDGDDAELKLFKMMKVSQVNLDDYFEAVDEGWDDDEMQKLEILTDDLGYSFDDAVDKMDDLVVYGEFDSEADFAQEYVDGMGGPSELGKKTLEQYFDYESFGNDLVLGGDIGVSGRTYYDPRSI